jgi:hypothetical protein
MRRMDANPIDVSLTEVILIGTGVTEMSLIARRTGVGLESIFLNGSVGEL